jgi:hypothetical protein
MESGKRGKREWVSEQKGSERKEMSGAGSGAFAAGKG